MSLAAGLAKPSPIPPTPARPLRVHYLIDQLDVGGTERQLLNLWRHLDRNVIAPDLTILKHPFVDRRDGVAPFTALGVHKLISPALVPGIRRFARQLQRAQTDILHTFFIDSTAFGLVAAYVAGTPVVVRSRNNMGFGLATARARALDRLCNRGVQAIVTNSDAGKQALVREDVPAEKVAVLRNGVGVPAALPVRREADGIHVGIVANLRPVKRLDVFLRAAALVARHFPDVRFHVAGEGPLRSALQELIASLGIESKVVLHGTVANVPQFLANLHVGVLCSDAEGMPNALLEYMAAGLPAVATAVGGCPEVIRHGVDGLLVPRGDPAALAEALASLIGSPQQAERLGANAHHRAACAFSFQAMMRQYQALYLRLCQGKNASR